MYSKEVQEGHERVSIEQSGQGITQDENSDVEVSQDIAEKALLERPSFSIRLHISLSFLFCFMMALVITIVLLMTVYKIEEKLYFLEVANSYLFEIQQARRFEKNFFLYGTNLEDALEHIQSARELLLLNADKLKKVTTDEIFKIKIRDVKHYETLLKRLFPSKNEKVNDKHRRNIKESETKIRKFGAEMVSFAQDLVYKERNAIDSMMSRMKIIPIFFLLILSILMIYIAAFLIRRIMGPIGRFLGYTKRIAEGDLSPIRPARRYRDEFSKLAIAINRMMRELNRRQEIIVESHKLRAVGTLTAGIAHELNNPINNITLTAYAMMEDYNETSDEERLEMINDLVNDANRSQIIVRNLLDFARESESKMESLDLGNIVKDTVRLASNQIKLSGVQLKANISPHLPRIHGDKQQLGQVFLNLIINALDAMHNKNGVLEVNINRSKQPNFLEVKFTDNGVGIPEHVLPSVFDPFFTTKDTIKGTGLGLSVSQGIIAKHGGHIDVVSKVGKGTTVTVSLPITTIPAQLEPI